MEQIRRENAFVPFSLEKLNEEQKVAIDILWSRGNLRFLLHPGQLKMFDFFEGKSFGAASTCRQIGKSFGAVAYCIEKCLQKPNQQIIYVAPTAKQVAGIAYKVLKSILATCPEDLLPHKTKEELYFQNGSVLMLAGCHNKGDRLRGKTANVVVIDEARDIPPDDFAYVCDSIIKPMLTTTGGQLLIITTPPDSPDHPFCMEWIPKAILNNSFYVANYKENPLIEPSFYRELLEQDKGENSSVDFRREYLADYTSADYRKLICPSFNYDEQISRCAEYDKRKSSIDRLRLFTGIDLGSVNATAIVFGVYDELQNVLKIIGERVFFHPTTKDIIANIMDGEKEVYKPLNVQNEITRITDIDLKFIQDCRREYNLNMRQVIKKDNISMLRHLDDHIRTGQTIVDVNACPILTQQLRCGLWKTTERRGYQPCADGSHYDAIDAVKYLDLSINRTLNTKPSPFQLFGKEAYTTMPNINKLTENRLPLDAFRANMPRF